MKGLDEACGKAGGHLKDMPPFIIIIPIAYSTHQ